MDKQDPQPLEEVPDRVILLLAILGPGKLPWGSLSTWLMRLSTLALLLQGRSLAWGPVSRLLIRLSKLGLHMQGMLMLSMGQFAKKADEAINNEPAPARWAVAIGSSVKIADGAINNQPSPAR